jgi:hypothetical protein
VLLACIDARPRWLLAGGTCLGDLGVLEAPLDTGATAPPSIALRTTGALTATVSVVQGQGYAACAPGVLPSASKPCELGATAVDAQGRNISVQVSTCVNSELEAHHVSTIIMLFKSPVRCLLLGTLFESPVTALWAMSCVGATG